MFQEFVLSSSMFQAKAGFPFQDIYLNSLYIITVYACTANAIRLIHFAYTYLIYITEHLGRLDFQLPS